MLCALSMNLFSKIKNTGGQGGGGGRGDPYTLTRGSHCSSRLPRPKLPSPSPFLNSWLIAFRMVYNEDCWRYKIVNAWEKTHTRAHTRMHAHTHTHVCLHAHTHTRTHTHTCKHTNTHIHAHTHTHSHTHTNQMRSNNTINAMACQSI